MANGNSQVTSFFASQRRASVSSHRFNSGFAFLVRSLNKAVLTDTSNFGKRRRSPPWGLGLFSWRGENLLRGKLLIAIDSRKCLSLVTAPKLERFGRGAVNRNGLTRVQANSHAG